MIRTSSVSILLALCVLAVSGDMYLHFPPGTNNRNRENQENRDNANRCFNSQNNAAGGYGVRNEEYYMYEGSTMSIEWTSQHSCGTGNADCEIIIQLLCESETGAGFRDGDLESDGDDTDRINTDISNVNDAAENADRCRYEPVSYFRAGETRDRNQGLYKGTRNINGDTAQYTRQSPNGDEYGLEIAEERDYYPYWHPTPYRDIAILTSNVTRCDFYLANSQNTVNKGQCTTSETANNPDDCPGAGWVETGAFEMDDPFCGPAPLSRDNHLGNGQGLSTNMYNYTWGEDDLPIPNRCQVRVRYNISALDFNGWEVDYVDDERTTVSQDPLVSLSANVELQLAMNVNQYPRTFQDRSSIFEIREKPSELNLCPNIWNFSVRGRRGNIVESYPSVEYDFTPTILEVNAGDCIHVWWSGTDAYRGGNGPAGEGDNRDAHNLVMIEDAGKNTPMDIVDWDFPQEILIGENNDVDWKIKAAQGCSTVANDVQINDAPYHCDLGVIKMGPTEKAYHVMSTRNNNFTNRSQKASIIVVGQSVFTNVAIIAGAVVGGVAVVGLGMVAMSRIRRGRQRSDSNSSNDSYGHYGYNDGPVQPGYGHNYGHNNNDYDMRQVSSASTFTRGAKPTAPPTYH